MSLVNVTADGGTTILAFTRPPANAFNLALVEDFAAALDALTRHPPAGGLVITGEGTVFSGGVDFKDAPRYGADERRRMIAGINRMIETLYALPCATVAAVNGHAIGGGFVVMLACDRRLAVGEAKLGLTEVAAGIPYPACPMEIVKAELDPSHRRALVLGGEIMSPQKALALGLLDELTPQADLLPRAAGVARAHAALPAFVRVKEQLRRDTIARLNHIIESASDPMLERWI